MRTNETADLAIGRSSPRFHAAGGARGPEAVAPRIRREREQMAQNVTGTSAARRRAKRQAAAAELVAGDYLTDRRIAARVGVHVATLARWKRRPEFRTRVDALVAEHRDRLWAEAHGRRSGETFATS
jgi:hypothetical protein